jgi:ABC-type multidrug transport system ATPase subunit
MRNDERKENAFPFILHGSSFIVMNTCSHCGTVNAAAHKFCQQCGRDLAAIGPEVPGSDATVQWTGQPVPSGVGLPRALAVEDLFGSKTQLVIGRSPHCDVCLPHPMVSRQHALLERRPEGLRLRDLQSVNGVSVGGRRLIEPLLIQERERVGIGPFLFSLAGGVIYLLDSSQRLRLEARQLEKVIALGRGQVRQLLDNINLAVEPGEFVSLLGPSGSGKSTLMDCLNGRRPATGGQVLANGEDFYRHFDSFRQSLGYVPQRDIVHTQLTVYRALYYTAKLRLPTDTEPGELAARIDEVVQQMELLPHRDTLVANLSGGQIKRVSLGAELLARPCLLYIDEATSGLDAGTEARMMRLFRQLADEGKSVICITHNVDNVDRCNLILVLARGKLVYFGPPQEAPVYFGVPRLSEVYDRLAEKAPEAWEKEFAASSLHQEFVDKRLAARSAETAERKPDSDPRAAEGLLGALRSSLPALPSLRSAKTVPPAPTCPPRAPFWHQFRVLTARSAELLWGDYRNLSLLLLQAPIVACFILLGFVDKPYQEKVLAPRELDDSERAALQLFNQVSKEAYEHHREEIAELDVTKKVDNLYALLQELPALDGPVVPDRLIINPRYTYMLQFLIVIIILWFGCNNAAKEIVKEEAIYGRERAVNLGILPYLASKFLILSLMTAIQTLLLMLVIYGALEWLHWQAGQAVPDPAYCLDYPTQFAVLVLLSMTGVALGLLLSACVTTSDRANTLLPYVLIPQIILGGGILTIKEGILYLAAVLLSPAYWGYRALHRGTTTLPKDIPLRMDYNDSVGLACAALVVQMAVLLLLTAWCLRRKDVRKA